MPPPSIHKQHIAADRRGAVVWHEKMKAFLFFQDVVGGRVSRDALGFVIIVVFFFVGRGALFDHGLVTLPLQNCFRFLVCLRNFVRWNSG